MFKTLLKMLITRGHSFRADWFIHCYAHLDELHNNIVGRHNSLSISRIKNLSVKLCANLILDIAAV